MRKMTSPVFNIGVELADTPKNVAWVREYWSALHPYVSGTYVNFLMEEGEERVRGSYGSNYARLAALKQRYDPTNLFRMNQNIKPSRSNGNETSMP